VQLPLTIVFDRRWFTARLFVRPDVAGLVLHADGRCEVERSDGRRDEVLIDPGNSVVLPGLVVLHYRFSGRRESLVLPRAGIDRMSHRRLRVWLRWQTLDAARKHDPT
jgi:hypothetical protein